MGLGGSETTTRSADETDDKPKAVAEKKRSNETLRVRCDDPPEEEESDEDVDELRTEPAGAAVGERFGVTLRRCKTVFDPVRQARAEGKPRGWRKGIWRPLGDMVDPAEAERDWREGD